MSDQGVLASFSRDKIYCMIVKKSHLKICVVTMLNQMNASILRDDTQHCLRSFVCILFSIMTLQILSGNFPSMGSFEERPVLLCDFEPMKLFGVPVRKHEKCLTSPHTY